MQNEVRQMDTDLSVSSVELIEDYDLRKLI